MAIATTIPSPEPVEFDATLAGGLDLMGLRLPAQTIGNNELNGVTTITPTLRYLSFRTWLLDRYLTAEPRRPDSYRDFVVYARHAEAALVLANLLRDPHTGGLIGPQKGALKLAEESDAWTLEPLAVQPAVKTYSRPSDQLRLTRARDPGVPKLGREHGLPLAAAVERSFGATSIGRRLRSGLPLDIATRAEIEEFGQVAWVGKIPEPERLQLIDALLPPGPAEDDIPRLRTCALLLSLSRLDGAVTEAALFYEALRPDRRVPASLEPCREGWARYAVRDAIAVAGEATLDVVARRVVAEDPEGLGLPDDRLVRGIVEVGADDAEGLLREMGLLGGEEDGMRLPFRALAGRVARATEGEVGAAGIRRWPGPLGESVIWNGARGARHGAPALGVLSWLLAERRAGEAVRMGAPGARDLSREGATRFGLEPVVLPRLRDWQRRDLPLAAVLAEYTHLVIDQHLRIVWSRLALDPRKDVSVLIRDGDRILLRSGFAPGRTASRLVQAIDWLRQLGLTDDGALAPEGERVLNRVLKTLGGSA